MSFALRLARSQWQRVHITCRWDQHPTKLPAYQCPSTWQQRCLKCLNTSSRSLSGEGSAERFDTVSSKNIRNLDQPSAQVPLTRTAQATRQQRQREARKATKVGPSTFVTAYCAAEAYEIRHVAQILEEAGYQLNAFDTNLAPHVVHFQKLSDDATTTIDKTPVDIFVLASGTVVVWGEVGMTYISDVLFPALAAAAEKAHEDTMELEDLEFCEDVKSENSYVNGDIITLGTRPPLSTTSKATGSLNVDQGLLRQQEANLLLAKVAFSFGLARSTKVAILESQLERYFISTRDIPTILKSGTKLPYSRQFVLRKIGELLSMRSQLNLSSELTDSLPNVFWDSRYELGLEGHFVQVSRALDIGVRIRALNEKMTYAQEIASVLQDRLSERHGFLLEWLIIALISVEICIEVARLVKERLERNNPHNLDSVIRQFLERVEVGKSS